MAKKKSKKSAYPPFFEMLKVRLRREGKYEEFMEKYKFHKDFGMRHAQAMQAAAKDMKATLAEEKKLYDEHQEKGSANYEREQRRAELDAQQLETELLQLQQRSEGQKFDPVTGIEWVASVFHVEHVGPNEAPHIIAWNILIQSRKYPTAFFKDFLMKALQKGITVESVEEYAEDETQLSELRREVQEAIGE